MRTVLYALSFLAVMGLAFWAYRENYATQKSINHVEALQDEIAMLRDALAVQRAEWAYLNRPDRIRELATIKLRPARPFAAGARAVRTARPGVVPAAALAVHPR